MSINLFVFAITLGAGFLLTRRITADQLAAEHALRESELLSNELEQSAYKKGMAFAGKDARNKLIIMSHALKLFKQNELSLEETLEMINRNTKEASDILDGLINQTETPT